MFTKIDVLERLILQYRVDEQKCHDIMIAHMLTWNDEKLKEEVKKACGCDLIGMEQNKYTFKLS